MQNLHTCNSVRLPVKLPSTPGHLPLLTATPHPTLHLLHRSHNPGGATLTLTSLPLPPSTVPVRHISIHTPHPTAVTALLPSPHASSDLILTLRSGHVYSVSPPDKVTLLADVTDEHDPSKSGVLACALSPDAHLLALLSPSKLTLLDASFSVLAEMPLSCVASHGALSWRSDGDFLVVTTRTAGSISAFVTDRTCSSIAHLDIGSSLSSQLAVCVDWEPRVGGAISIAGPGNAVTFFERNGQRLRRRDLKLVSNGPPKKLRWSPDCKCLAIACEESEDQGEGDAWRVAFYQMTNYRWYCKRRIIVSHRVLDMVWDEDDPSSVTIVTERDVFRMRVMSVASTMVSCEDYSIAAVVDGQYVLLTDFSKAIVPPPLAHASVHCDEDVVAIAADRHGAGFVALTANAVLNWFLFEPPALGNPHTGAPPPISPHPPQLSHCVKGRKILRPVDGGQRDHEHNGDAVVVSAGFRMPVMSSRNCVVVVGTGGVWRDRESAQPGDALYMFKLRTTTTGLNNINNGTKEIVHADNLNNDGKSRMNTNNGQISTSDSYKHHHHDPHHSLDSDIDINHSKQLPQREQQLLGLMGGDRFGHGNDSDEEDDDDDGDDDDFDDDDDEATGGTGLKNNKTRIVKCEQTDVCSRWGEAYRLLMDGHVAAMGHSSEEMSIIVTTTVGVVMRVVVDEYAGRMVEVSRVPNMSTCVRQVQEVRTGGGRALTILHDEEGRLEVVELANGRHLNVSRECTSFCVYEGFLIFTTRSHLLYCIVLDTKCTLFNPANRESVPSIIDTLDDTSAVGNQVMPQLREGHGATRPIDRGSLIVTALQGKTDIILQAPRGNLETISPRPVVYEVVDRLAKAKEYAKAFELCRRQRVDMNHVVDANFDAFLCNIDHFVTQVRDAGHLSVFMTFLNGDTDKINKVCRAIVKHLLLLTDKTREQQEQQRNPSVSASLSSTSVATSISPDNNPSPNSISVSTTTNSSLTSTTTTTSTISSATQKINHHHHNNNSKNNIHHINYTSAVLTGLIRQKPSDIVGALNQISNLRTQNVDEAKSAVDFLFVLVKDEKRVYMEALGMYDLTLCSFVAECSQMDPAEYSREVHELRQISTDSERRYLIDLKLERFDMALKHLYSCGSHRYDDCVKLCHKHALYETALQLFYTDGPIRSDLLSGYAVHMRDVAAKHETAATLFLLVNKWKEAADCFRHANKWETAIFAIGKCDVPEEEKTEFYGNMADQLAENGLAIPAARVRVAQLDDIDGAIEVLASADEWNAAFEAVNCYEMTVARLHADGDRDSMFSNGAVAMSKGEGSDEAQKEEGQHMQIDGNNKVQHARDTLVRHIVEGYESLLSTLTENKDKLRERGARLRTLIEVADKIRQSMTSNANWQRGGGSGVGNNNNDNDMTMTDSHQQPPSKHHHGSEVESDVFSATSASSLGSHLSDVTFTNKSSATSLYSSSVGPGVLSSAKLEKQALRRQQRMSKKRIREGHPNEREYLVGYLRKLLPSPFLCARVQRIVDALIFTQRPDLAMKARNGLGQLVEQALDLPSVVVDQTTKGNLLRIMDELQQGSGSDMYLCLKYAVASPQGTTGGQAEEHIRPVGTTDVEMEVRKDD